MQTWKPAKGLNMKPRKTKEQWDNLGKKRGKKKIYKPPKKVSNKLKQERMEGGQQKLFDEIWKEQEHICWNCGNRIQEKATYVFAHILAKGMYKKYKLHKGNIGLVCSIKCHDELNTYIVGNKRILEMELKAEGEISKDFLLSLQY